MAKIFQLEFFIKEMIVWKLPKNSEECDETCIEITVFGHKEVPISGYAFGKSSALSRGQNFLFTLNEMPSETVSFKIFKKSFSRDKIFLGSGRIPIEKIFEDIFLKTFGNPRESHDNYELKENSDVEIPETQVSDSRPISRITKDLHPVIGEDSTQWGSICILMRLTSFGDYTANPIHIHQSRSQRNQADQAFYNCTKVDRSKNTADGKVTLWNEKNKEKFCKRHQPMNNIATGLDEKCKEETSSELDLCPCPPGSAIRDDCEYEEFKAEINENVLCVRLPKNTGTVKRVYSRDFNTKELKYLNDRENTRNNHLKSIPIIRGTRKYPAYYGINFDCPACPDENIEQNQIKTKEFSLQCTEERILESDKIECPSDVQIFRKNNDPKRDVFVLKIGKEVGAGKQNEIQLEMKTPKNSYTSRPTTKYTQAAQTNDEEFSGKKSNVGMNVDSEEGNVGAKQKKSKKSKRGK